MAGVRNKPKPNGKYQAWYTDYRGDRKYFMGTTKKIDTRKMAEDLESKNRQIKMGTALPKSSVAKNAERPFRQVADEYLAWGNSQGGLGGRSWGKTHTKERTNKLGWWEKRLKLKRLSDLYGVLPEVERALRELQAGGHSGSRDGISGKTLKNYAECLRTFCCWAKKRGYLDRNPLEDLVSFEGAPESTKRALTPGELGRVMAVAPEHRRLLYEVALVTGLRAGELRSLTPACVDLKRSVLILSADWTKNRKPGLQPIPGELALRLVEYGKSGVAAELYEKHYSRSDAKVAEIPAKPLLFISTHPSRELDKDLEAAGIPKDIPDEGKVDFHSLRMCFITNIVNAGANIKEVQTLARHSNPNLTMNTYARARTDNMAALVNQVSSTVLEQTERAQCVHIDENGGDSQPAISSSDNNIDGVLEWWRRRDSNPRPVTGTRQALHA